MYQWDMGVKWSMDKRKMEYGEMQGRVKDEEREMRSGPMKG